MKLTIEQALQQALAAQVEGKLQDAERLYRAILQSQPKNPAANHNLGLIAVSVNKADAALPLFKTALEGDPKIEQYWLNYVQALVKAEKFELAEDIIDQGKARGVPAEKLDPFSVKKNHVNPPLKIEVIRNYMPEAEFSDLLKMIGNLPWALSKRMNPDSNKEHHFAFIQDYASDHFRNSFEALEATGNIVMRPYSVKHGMTASIDRFRTNLYIKTVDYQDGCGMHQDNPASACFTLLLYMEDSNGATEFRRTGERVVSERNKAIIFPSNEWHQTVSQTNVLYRMNVNINFFKSYEKA